MDSEQPFMNKEYNSLEDNQYPKSEEINTTPYSKTNENPSDIYLVQQIPQNDYPAPPQGINANTPYNMQYQNSSNFPQYDNNLEKNGINQQEIDYSKYNNINQLPHRGIKQVDDNTFFVSSKCCDKIFPIIWILISLLISSVVFWTKEIKAITMTISIFGGASTLIGFVMLFRWYHGYYFQTNPNNITLKEAAWCCKKSTIYLAGHISSINFDVKNNINKKGKLWYSYSVTINQNIRFPQEQVIFLGADYSHLYTEEEIGFFNYIMNSHIRKNLKNQIMVNQNVLFDD